MPVVPSHEVMVKLPVCQVTAHVTSGPSYSVSATVVEVSWGLVRYSIVFD